MGVCAACSPAPPSLVNLDLLRYALRVAAFLLVKPPGFGSRAQVGVTPPAHKLLIVKDLQQVPEVVCKLWDIRLQTPGGWVRGWPGGPRKKNRAPVSTLRDVDFGYADVEKVGFVDNGYAGVDFG